MLRRLGILFPIVLMVITSVVAYAQESSDYDYVTQVVVHNGTGSTIVSTAVRAPINAANLVSAGFLASDGQDILVLETGGTEAQIVAQIDGNPSSWWIPISDLADQSSKTFSIYTGQNTTTADNPQSLFFQSSVESATAPNDASLDIADLLTIRLDGLRFTGYPGSTQVIFEYKTANKGYAVKLDSTGHVVFVTGRFTDGDVTATSSGALALNTDHTVVLTLDTTRTPVMAIVINGATDGTDDSSAFTIAFGAEIVNLSAAAGGMSIGQVRVGDTSVTSPTWQLDWQFEPDQMAQTQEGTSGNSWNWLGTISDESANTNTGTYRFVRDMTDITVTVGPIAPVTTSQATAGETNPSFVSGTVNSPVSNPYTNPNATTDFGFPFDILAIAADSGSDGVPLQLLGLTIVLIGGSIAGFFTFRATRTPGLAMLVTAVITGMLIYLTPVTNMVMLLVVIPSLAMVILIPRPFEARG